MVNWLEFCELIISSCGFAKIGRGDSAGDATGTFISSIGEDETGNGNR